MNAGHDYQTARRQAQANANVSGQPRYLHFYAGVWWVSNTPTENSERIAPQPTERRQMPARKIVDGAEIKGDTVQ